MGLKVRSGISRVMLYFGYYYSVLAISCISLIQIELLKIMDKIYFLGNNLLEGSI